MAVAASHKADATADRIASMAVPTSGLWLDAAQRDALDRLRAMGIPHRRDEYWRYTDPATLNAAQAPDADLGPADEVPVFTPIERLKIVFVDGVFDAQSSDDLTLEGVEIDRLDDVRQTDIHWARDIYGVLEGRGHKPVARPLAALNTACATDGILIRVTRPVSRPISIIYKRKSVSSDVILRHCIKLEPGAELTLLENGPAAARLNKVTEVEIGDGATLHHIRMQGRDRQRRAVTHLFARLGTGSHLRSFTLTANGALTRNEAVIDLDGPDASAHIAGAALGDGDFHQDDTVFITHSAPDCESRQVFKKVLRNGATGVFQGKILVQQAAQKTDGFQIAQALLLDDDAQFLAKPELEIYADDVLCSHGSTTGAIDDEALFYLRARGVPRREATDMLVQAFLAEAIEEVTDDKIADEIRDRLKAWLDRRR